MSVVYVLSKEGKPLMPTTRGGHTRVLLEQGKARVVSTNPFTIQLLYETANATQPLALGIDLGRTNIGMAVVREDGRAVVVEQAETRNKEVPKRMKERKTFRQAHRKHRREKRQRRAVAAGTTVRGGKIDRVLPGYEKSVTCKQIRNKEARFNNRKRPKGWLTPTANHLLQTHLSLVVKMCKLLPVTDIVLEVNKFAFMQMDDPNIQRWQYQRGPLYGKGSVEDAVSAMQEGKCLFCSNPIEHFHHVVPRRKNGSEVLENRAGLCSKHHALVHTDSEWAKKLASQRAGLNKKYHALSVLNQIMPQLQAQLGELLPGHVYATTGRDTAAFRADHAIPKDHWLDAYCIACSILEGSDERVLKMKPLQAKQFRRHDRQACHQENRKRVYLKDGNPVATNRHKAFEQKEPSLANYVAAGGNPDCLTVKPHTSVYKRSDRTMPGALFAVRNDFRVMVASSGLHNGKPDYYYFADGSKATTKKCRQVLTNRGLSYV